MRIEAKHALATERPFFDLPDGGVAIKDRERELAALARAGHPLIFGFRRPPFEDKTLRTAADARKKRPHPVEPRVKRG